MSNIEDAIGPQDDLPQLCTIHPASTFFEVQGGEFHDLERGETETFLVHNISDIPIIINPEDYQLELQRVIEDVEEIHNVESVQDASQEIISIESAREETGLEVGRDISAEIGELEISAENTIIENDGSLNAEIGEPEQPSDNGENIEEEGNMKTRKWQRKEHTWKCNVRKRKYEAVEAYVSKRGKLVEAKTVKTKKDCVAKCKFRCSKQITEDERDCLFKSFYKLDYNQKRHYISKTTERLLKCRTYPKKDVSRRTYSFKYFFEVKSVRIQVCKVFYLTTLHISQKPVYNVHKEKNTTSGVPKNHCRGKISSRKLNEEIKLQVMDHIKIFPHVDSHYCRKDTNKQYLDSNLNINRMFNLYVEWCEAKNCEPVKKSMYRKIFCEQFNLDFHKPKKDLCHVCEEKQVIQEENREMSEELKEKFIKHCNLKENMRREKEEDKLNTTEIPILVFDLQNVITVPNCNIGTFFYLQKLTCFNLTAHLKVGKKSTVYNAVWNEGITGRSGNDIASAFLQILERVAKDNKNIRNLVTWSDSCVSQNRNSMMSYAVMYFLKNHPQMESITMKYSVPGHSGVQEVDNSHSQIEKTFRTNEFFSPIGLVRVLKMVNRKNQFVVIQLNKQHFLDFGSCSKIFNYKIVPYTKVVSIKYTQSLFQVEFKMNYNVIGSYRKVNIKSNEQRISRQSKKPKSTTFVFPEPKTNTKIVELSKEKKAALKKMLYVMSDQDKEYYRKVVKIN